MKDFRAFIQNFVDLSNEEFADISTKFKLKTFAAAEVISAQGTVVREYFFVNKGSLKIINEDEENSAVHSCWFAQEGEFFTELVSLRLKKPSRYSIVAAADSEIYSLTDEDMELLYQKYPNWQKFGRKLWESAFVRMDERLFSFQTEKAEARYLKNLKNGLAQKIPLKELSSFIGITPNSLSRIRKNIK